MKSRRDIEQRRRHPRVGFHHLGIGGKADARHELLDGFAREIDIRACRIRDPVGRHLQPQGGGCHSGGGDGTDGAHAMRRKPGSLILRSPVWLANRQQARAPLRAPAGY